MKKFYETPQKTTFRPAQTRMGLDTRRISSDIYMNGAPGDEGLCVAMVRTTQINSLVYRARVTATPQALLLLGSGVRVTHETYFQVEIPEALQERMRARHEQEVQDALKALK